MAKSRTKKQLEDELFHSVSLDELRLIHTNIVQEADNLFAKYNFVLGRANLCETLIEQLEGREVCPSNNLDSGGGCDGD
jgi:hypothetical protein